MKATERSRAYPILSLEDSRRVMGEILAGLGRGSFSREVLGEALGYSNAQGGPGARKIAALVQYGFLRRKAGLYSPTALAREAVEPRSAAASASALLRALRHPPLFAALLDRYRPQGRVPTQLASVLWRDFGITRKASRAAAETFRKSARYAGVLDSAGAFLPDHEDRQSDRMDRTGRTAQPSRTPVAGPPATSGHGTSEQRFELVLTEGKVARLFLPLELCRKDLEIVRKQIDFLEYQVAEEDSA